MMFLIYYYELIKLLEKYDFIINLYVKVIE